MNKRLFSIGLAVVFVSSSVILSATAAADHPRIKPDMARAVGKAVRSGLAGNHSRGLRIPAISGNRRGGPVRPFQSTLTDLSTNAGRHGHSGGGRALNNPGDLVNTLLNQAYSGRSGHKHRALDDFGYGNSPAYGPRAVPQYYPEYGYGDPMAGAYRDVGIANAVVNLLGIALTNGQNRVYVQPAGHYERQQVLVSPAHYETYQVWIPEVYDPNTGLRTGGYYETRTRIAPDAYGYRDVWVPSPVTP